MELTKKNLKLCYVQRKLSTRECAKIFGVTQNKICTKMRWWGIKGRPYTENKMPVQKGDHLSETHRKAISKHHKNDPNWHTKGRYGRDHYNWKGGVRSYRRSKLSEVPLECSICEKKEVIKRRSSLEVHHIDGNRNNNSLDNLQVLCAGCHKKIHNLAKQ